MRKGNKSGWLTLVFTSSVDDGCIQRNMQNHGWISRSTIAWLQEGVTSCRRVRVDFDRLKTLKKGDRLALLPGHGVSSSAPMSSNLVIWESSIDIKVSQKLSKSYQIISSKQGDPWAPERPWGNGQWRNLPLLLHWWDPLHYRVSSDQRNIA